jgi:hypothetical protein
MEAGYFLKRKIRVRVDQRRELMVTPAERQELLQYSQRIAELLYQEAREQEHPISNLGAIESTVVS